MTNQSSTTDAMSYLFQDLDQIEVNKIPTLNNLITISLEDGGSSLTLKEWSCNLKQSKLIANFINTLDNSDLNEFSQLLDNCRSELSSKIEDLKKQRLN